MTYYTIQPPAHLSFYVRYFWVLESDVDESMPFQHQSMADGCPELLFHYKGQFQRMNPEGREEGCFISGLQAQSQHSKTFSAKDDLGLFGVSLYPYAIPELLGIPSAEFSNLMPDLSQLLGCHSSGLEEKIMLCTNNRQRMAIICEFLETKLRSVSTQNQGISKTINFLLNSKENQDIIALAERNFLSLRQFERNFKQLSGFSPKLFTRIRRFQSALEKHRDTGLSLTQIAYDCGYYDQSHFIREFREFSGNHPGHFFSGKASPTAYTMA